MARMCHIGAAVARRDSSVVLPRSTIQNVTVLLEPIPVALAIFVLLHPTRAVIVEGEMTIPINLISVDLPALEAPSQSDETPKGKADQQENVPDEFEIRRRLFFKSEGSRCGRIDGGSTR